MQNHASQNRNKLLDMLVVENVMLHLGLVYIWHFSTL